MAGRIAATLATAGPHTESIFAALDAALVETPTEELPALVGRLVEAEERARLRLRSVQVVAPTPPSPTAFITAEQAGEIAGVNAKRIYEWARMARWASRPTKRCLRIDESGFRAWLTSRT